ncbi:alpha/beta hydrolase [Cellulomonas chengniuliangii]|uniref:alpha/beta hydrolase n=1 Tax=Cellulomonas chengniuliangii TaxID=2968084 RepID=UPI001D0F2CE5|nr:alpha/beta hydrolase [Cellulomonas chengniuliangii]MCC2318831.1 alpha/beta hydrolase [Cellulomonas chengniuliangii]
MPDDALATRPASPAPDVLGEGWTAQTLPLRPDRSGRSPVATLVRRTPDPGAPAARRAVLYVHGFVDYFFQRHVGDAFAAHGDDFYALDLRGYGRSLLPWQEPNYVTDLSVHSEELDAAARLLLVDHDELVLMGHSTGGLIAALWADARRDDGVVGALVLNSPWLDLRGSWFERVVATRLIDVAGPLAPRLVVGKLSPHYGQALHAASGGEWDYDLAWKPHGGFPVRAGWLRTVRRGHARVARGLAISCPVLVLASDATGPDDRWHDALLSTDSVLDVAQIAARSARLGPDTTFVEVPGGAHDLALSAEQARGRYLREVLDWLDALPADRLGDSLKHK